MSFDKLNSINICDFRLAHDCVMRLSNVGEIAIIDWKRKLNLLFLYEFFHRDFYFFVYRFPLEAEAAVSDKRV